MVCDSSDLHDCLGMLLYLFTGAAEIDYIFLHFRVPRQHNGINIFRDTLVGNIIGFQSNPLPTGSVEI